MKIIACLGNPGKKYAKNRHNCGHIIGRHIAHECGITVKKKQFSSLTGSGDLEGERVLLVFPQTFMNNSGTAVQAALEYTGEPIGNLIVIHDEIELPFGEIRVKNGGGHKGHNGIRSIMNHLESGDFYRLRFGVGRPHICGMEVADYLLSDLSPDELEQIEADSPQIFEALKSILAGAQ